MPRKLLVAAMLTCFAASPAAAQESMEERTLHLEARPVSPDTPLAEGFSDIDRSDYRIGR